jgi:vacuolar-type H+-ATPase subunit F/Vma7
LLVWEAFTLGFELAGIRHIFRPKKDLMDSFSEIKQNKEIGITIVEESLLSQLESHDRTEIEDEVDPVFIPLGTKSDSDSIRKLIIKSIGIDLWKE